MIFNWYATLLPRQYDTLFSGSILYYSHTTLEMLFKADNADGLEHFDSVNSFEQLIDELVLSSKHLARNKSAKHVVLTLGQFDDIREEIYSSYSQSGCMDEDAAQSAVRAYRSMTKAERANLISPLY